MQVVFNYKDTAFMTSYQRNRQINGFIFIAIGAIILLYALSALLWRVVLGAVGFVLINDGLRMCGLPNLQTMVSMWLQRIRF